MSRKSSPRTLRYRQIPSQHAELLASFRQQMADYARGEELRRLREARHLSQEEAAHDIGTTAKSLRSWEKGGTIRWANAQKLGRFYKVKPQTLVRHESNVDFMSMNGDGEQRTPPDARLDHLERRVEHLIGYQRATQGLLLAIGGHLQIDPLPEPYIEPEEATGN